MPWFKLMFNCLSCSSQRNRLFRTCWQPASHPREQQKKSTKKTFHWKKSASVLSPTAATVYFLQNLPEPYCEAKSWNLLRNLLNLTWLCTKASWNLLQNLFRNLLQTLVEPNLALHQKPPNLRNPGKKTYLAAPNLPDLLRNLLRNPVEPELALHQSLPDLPRNG